MDGWQDGKLADVCESTDFGFTASAIDSPAGPKFLRITDIVRSALNWGEVPYVVASEKEVEKYKLNDGDIVIARTDHADPMTRIKKINIPLQSISSYMELLRNILLPFGSNRRMIFCYMVTALGNQSYMTFSQLLHYWQKRAVGEEPR